MRSIFWMTVAYSMTINPLELITNGMQRAYEDIPYLVTVHKLESGYCSGVSISESWVLTTQYCLQTSAEDDSLTAIDSSKM
ncbi:hypothetical protein K7432_004154 [Basidiobolus ranarum]|uniref:Peptidase S1 domain-containing protein n=1 Tax=Basidiobolus ranarum TaxID=34480 RepID=A0ABR2WYP4_9FUNG